MIFVQHQVKDAVEKYLDKSYIQHNPYVPNGGQPLVDYFVPYFKTHPQTQVAVKRVIAEGDLVVVHSHWKENDSDRGSAVMDIFRVADGRIVEHWDTVQAVPEKSANSNTMF